jgi:hypothetical protein
VDDNRQSDEEKQEHAATSQVGDAVSEELLSDSEDEQQEFQNALRSIDALFANATSREEANAKEAKRPKDDSRVEILLLARQLLQMQSDGVSQSVDGIKASMGSASGAQSSDAEIQAGNAGIAGDDAGEPPVPQAREFMASMGFSAFDEIKDGQTLVVHCYESRRRILGEPL